MTREEAIEVYNGLINQKIKEAFEFFAPELKESEDERIRKFLVDYFASYKIGNVTTKLNGVRIDDILAYLEKQKINTEGDFGRGYDCGYEACLNSHGAEWFEKQKENPKSADSIPSDCTSDAKCEDRWHKVADFLPDSGRDVLAKDALGNYLLASFDGDQWFVSVYDGEDKPIVYTPAIKEWCDIPSEKQKEQKHPDGCFTCDEYKKGYEEGGRNGFTAGYNKAMKEVEQKQEYPLTPDECIKPTEWSEVELTFRGEKIKVKRPFYRDDKGRGYSTTEQDDEVTWNALRAWAESHGHTPFELYPREEWSEEDEKMIDTIVYVLGQYIDYKAVSGNGSGYAIPRYSKEIDWLKSLKPQPKQEWSEEDEEVRRQLICVLSGGIALTTKETRSKMLEWLKSLRPSWKPSELHLSALLAVFNDPNNIDSQTCQLALTDLYEQLKKL